MYQAIVRRIVRAGFRALSAGDYEHVLRQFHPQVIYSFAGPPPLGGERRGVEDVRARFQRIYSYFPGIQLSYLVNKIQKEKAHNDGFITRRAREVAQICQRARYASTVGGAGR